MKKKLFVACVLMLVACTLVFATGSKEEQTSRPEVIKLQVWYGISGASGETFVRLANEFDASRSDIELELTYSGSYADSATKISAAQLSNTAPDVALTAAGQLFTGERGNFRMEELIKDPEFNKDDIYEGMWKYSMYENRIAAVPYGISTQVIFYNKKIFDKAGIDLEKNPPKTWDELLQVAKLAQQNGNINNSSDFWGFDTSDGVWMIKSMLNQIGNPVVEVKDGKVNPVFDNAQGVQVGEFWKKMVDEKVMPAAQHSNAESRFLAGNLAFIAASSVRISRWSNSDVVELGAIVMPSFTQSSVALGGNGMVILTQDQYREEAAWEFIKYMLSVEKQTEFALAAGYLPIRKSAANLPQVQERLASNSLFNAAFKQLDYTWAYYHFGEMGTMDAYFWYALDEIETYTLTPEAALKKAADQVRKEIP